MAFYPSYMYPQAASFTQQYQLPQPQFPAPQTQAQTGNEDSRIWVANRNAADAYLLAPNGFVRLWDSSAPRFYEKRADQSGRPFPMEVYEYKRERMNDARPMPADTGIDYGEELKGLKARVDALERMRDVRTESNADVKSVQ